MRPRLNTTVSRALLRSRETGGQASMRPRHFTADNSGVILRRGRLEAASMRRGQLSRVGEGKRNDDQPNSYRNSAFTVFGRERPFIVLLGLTQ